MSCSNFSKFDCATHCLLTSHSDCWLKSLHNLINQLIKCMLLTIFDHSYALNLVDVIVAQPVMGVGAARRTAVVKSHVLITARRTGWGLHKQLVSVNTEFLLVIQWFALEQGARLDRVWVQRFVFLVVLARVRDGMAQFRACMGCSNGLHISFNWHLVNLFYCCCKSADLYKN